MLPLVVNWGDVARWLVFSGVPLLVGGVLILRLRRQRMTRPWGRPVRYRRYSLRWLAAVLVTVLIADAAALLGAIVKPALGGGSESGFLVAMIIFVVWFYRARVNAEGHGWPQRWPRGLAIWAWLVPVFDFYVPFQIMADIWRAGLPARARAERAIFPGIWWACLLAFICLLPYAPAGHANRAWYVAMPVCGIGALAVIMTALLVQKVSSGPLGLKDAEALEAPSVLDPPRN